MRLVARWRTPMGKQSDKTERIGKESSHNARRREKGNVMTWGDCVEWAIVAIPFIGMSAIPVVVNLAVTGWEIPHVSWGAWVLSAPADVWGEA